VLPLKHFDHGFLLDFRHGAIGHCGRGAQAKRLPNKTTFAEEISLFRMPIVASFPTCDTTFSG
jgi:hypothetical protein